MAGMYECMDRWMDRCIHLDLELTFYIHQSLIYPPIHLPIHPSIYLSIGEKGHMKEAQAMYRRAYLAAQQKDDAGELASLRLQVCIYLCMYLSMDRREGAYGRSAGYVSTGLSSCSTER